MASTKSIKPRKKAIQERSRFTVETIYEAAVQVFTENGYAGATTDLIAVRAGVSVGTLYQYFPNKKAILIELWNRSMADADRARELYVARCRQTTDSGPEMLKGILRGVYLLHKETIKPQLFFEDVPQPAFIKARLLEKESITIQQFSSFLQHSSRLRKRELNVAARVMYEVMERLIHRYLTHFQHELSEDEFILEMSDIIGRYLFADCP